MLFNSYIFIFLMLPLTLILYFGLNYFNCQKMSLLSLLIMSLWFYGYFNYSYLLILCSSILVNWGVSRTIIVCKYKKISLYFGLIFNTGLIFYFKYFDFFVDNVNLVFKTNLPLLNIVLPLGISFFTFQQISYIVDSYKGKTTKYNFLEYAIFVAFFPQLVAGPIVLHNELVPQFYDNTKKKINYDNFAKGIYKLSIGLFKKVIVADKLSVIVNFIWDLPEDDITSPLVLIASLAYTLQIYYDFSGYSDMAIGIGNMFNLDLPINFNSPYKSTSISDFWNRWHLTLSRFLKEYIYIPLGGNRKGKARTYINLFLVFFVSGVWHGANWTFIMWGMLHGIANIAQRLFNQTNIKLNKFLSWVITFYFVNLAWIFFRAPNLSQSIFFIKKLIFFDGIRLSDNLTNSYINLVLGIVSYPLNLLGIPLDVAWILLYFGILILLILITVIVKNIHEVEFKPSWIRLGLSVVCYFICIISFSEVSEFLYFNF